MDQAVHYFFLHPFLLVFLHRRHKPFHSCCSSAVGVVVFDQEKGGWRTIRCCWSAATRASSHDCVYGKRLSHTHKCWSWWRRLEPLWSAEGGNLAERNQVREARMCRSVRWICDQTQKYEPANSPVTPSCAKILLITLKVEEETLCDTEKTRINIYEHIRWSSNHKQYNELICP